MVSCIYSYVWCLVYFFFFKQKTAYEMRISDWSSDVCSSDLQAPALIVGHVAGTDLPSAQILIRHAQSMLPAYMVPHSIVLHERLPRGPSGKIGRASCRERVCQSV